MTLFQPIKDDDVTKLGLHKTENGVIIRIPQSMQDKVLTDNRLKQAFLDFSTSFLLDMPCDYKMLVIMKKGSVVYTSLPKFMPEEKLTLYSYEDFLMAEFNLQIVDRTMLADSYEWVYVLYRLNNVLKL